MDNGDQLCFRRTFDFVTCHYHDETFWFIRDNEIHKISHSNHSHQKRTVIKQCVPFGCDQWKLVGHDDQTRNSMKRKRFCLSLLMIHVLVNQPRFQRLLGQEALGSRLLVNYISAFYLQRYRDRIITNADLGHLLSKMEF